MTTKSRSLRNFRNPIGCLILLAALGAAAGCSTAESPGGSATNMNHVLPSGSSVPGWLVVPSGGSHASTATLDYIANGGSSGCAQCHGSDLSGGISRVSCFGNPAGCHHGPLPDWVQEQAPGEQFPQGHGISAKKAPGSSGFVSCKICHAADFSGGGADVSCTNTDADCHGVGVRSPHPARPWLRGVSGGKTHTDTAPQNADVCSSCHAGGSNTNPPHPPPDPASAGTPPGCFNGTMCHNQPGAPHPLGDPAWRTTPPAAQPHGDAAKATPGSTTGFAYCQDCHGTGTTSPANFGGGVSGVSCYPCHGGTHPHPDAPWRTSAGSDYSHTSTDKANAPVCRQCHFPGSPNNPADHPPTPAPAETPPDCFNNTLCHGSVAPHNVPYNEASHYAVTSATFQETCGACHDVSAPSTKSGPICQSCHVGASPLTALNCTSCHALPPNSGAPAGAVYPNIAGAHSTHIALDNAGSPVSCDTCHDGLGPSLLNENHYDRAKSRVEPGDVLFLATYKALSGASSFDNGLAVLSCSNVSCHGGQATPNWKIGTLVVNDQCTNCHALGTSQYNSYNSGEHALHVNALGATATTCKFCHNTTTLPADHFTTLADNSISPAVAAATVGGGETAIITWTPAAGTSSGTCLAACHSSEVRTW